MGVLRNPKHEAYARERSYLTRPLEAARVAGYARMTAGNAAKLDRNAKIRARIAELSKADEELVAMRRRFLERTLLRVAMADALDLWEPVLGAAGKPIAGRWRLRDLGGLPVDLRQAVKAITIDDGKIKVEMLDKLAATAQLQKLWGLEAVPEDDRAGGAGTTVNMNVLQLMQNVGELSPLELARRIAFTLEAGARQAETKPETAPADLPADGASA